MDKLTTCTVSFGGEVIQSKKYSKAILFLEDEITENLNSITINTKPDIELTLMSVETFKTHIINNPQEQKSQICISYNEVVLYFNSFEDFFNSIDQSKANIMVDLKS